MQDNAIISEMRGRYLATRGGLGRASTRAAGTLMLAISGLAVMQLFLCAVIATAYVIMVASCAMRMRKAIFFFICNDEVNTFRK